MSEKSLTDESKKAERVKNRGIRICENFFLIVFSVSNVHSINILESFAFPSVQLYH